jgi:predicted AlkP superfamily phosphohydrolase/phosphomutase
MSRNVLLIGLDGATFDVLDPLIADGVMPALQRLIGSGVRATLRSTVPALTPPAWTSLVSGRGPGAHGIFDFFRKDTPTSPSVRFLTSRDVECPTMWSLASDAGLRSTVLNFPLTFPAPRIAGHVVPGGFMPWRQLRLGCHPEGLFDRLRAVPSFNPRELALDMGHEAKALDGCADEEYVPWIEMHIRRERQWIDIARHLLHEEPSEFMALLFDGTDKIQHLCWRFVDPAMSGGIATAWERTVRDKCREYYRELDTLIGELCDTIPDATVFVTSDHGFGPQVRTFFVNSWLERAGLLAWHEGKAPQAAGAASLGLNQLARHVYQIDWTRTRAYAPLPSGNGIHLVIADEAHPGGVPAADYHRCRREIAEGLMNVRDPETGERVVERVWPREELFQGPHLALAPDLTLELSDGGLMSILASEEAVRRRPAPSGTHRPDGIFVACGEEYKQGARVDPLSILDVAPLMLHALGLPIPSSLEGRVAYEVFDPAALAARPPQLDASAAAVASTMDAALDAEAEAEIIERLQALGYVE